jgi:hypothetical protein
MKFKKGFAIVTIPIYHGKIYVKHSKDFLKDAHKIGVELQPNANDFLAIAFRKSYKGAGKYVMLLNKGATPDVVAHESLHIANFILFDRGIEGDFKNDEAQAYLLTWIVAQIEIIKKAR